MNADKTSNREVGPGADARVRRAVVRRSAALAGFFPRPARLAERPAVRVRKDPAAFLEIFTPVVPHRVLNRFGETAPDGRGSVTVALISKGLLSRDRQGAVSVNQDSPIRLSTHARRPAPMADYKIIV